MPNLLQVRKESDDKDVDYAVIGKWNLTIYSGLKNQLDCVQN